jgi:Coenzyme PQQ synthesis protein D (PqqD)
MRFQINSPHVVSETIQGETIVSDLTTGTYYSLEQTGAEIWEALANSVSISEIVEQLDRKYLADRAEIERAVRELARELQDESLIVETDVAALPSSSNGQTAAAAANLPFTVPRIARHTDLQDIILLDPVHEVDDRGWPYVAEVAQQD